MARFFNSYQFKENSDPILADAAVKAQETGWPLNQDLQTGIRLLDNLRQGLADYATSQPGSIGETIFRQELERNLKEAEVLIGKGQLNPYHLIKIFGTATRAVSSWR